MKKIHRYVLFIPLAFCLVLVSCSKDDDNPAPDGTATFEGTFISQAHPTCGTASVIEDGSKLVFAGFKTDSGPALDIYLVSDLGDIEGDFVNLGEIKGVNGNYVYDVPGGTDFSVYKYVVVWCVAFNVNFGYAELEKI